MESIPSLVDLCLSQSRPSSPDAGCNISNFSFTDSDSNRPLSFGLDLSDPVAHSMVKHNQPKASPLRPVMVPSDSGGPAQEISSDEGIRQVQTNRSPMARDNQNQPNPLPPLFSEACAHPDGSMAQEQIQARASPVSAMIVYSRSDHETRAFRSRASNPSTPTATALGSADPVRVYPGTGSLRQLQDWTKSALSSLENEIQMSTGLTKLKMDAIQTTVRLNEAIAMALELDSELKQQRKKIEELEEALEALPSTNSGRKR
ncbi:hypothetical protein EMPS_04295 [Entomortierella parvispora]|uniref:Uncharacterized protein n=1 Tax=Entomortierella parvispora TaxID=205924 RepID=A0A9P3H8T9_9FUNG|nr:hypothetical protein EMPS_04295 [Entomortierella parvispora]